MLCGCAASGRASRFPVLIPIRTVSSSGGLVSPPANPTRGNIDHAQSPPTDLVQLWVRDSFHQRTLALHPFFVAYDRQRNRWEQWEVWAGDQFGFYTNERPTRCDYSSMQSEPATFTHRQVGCVRSQSPIVYVDESDSERMLAEWTGDTARRLLATLRQPERYPDHDTYRIWPGPNSNGYARWVLDEAAVGIDLNPKMVGKDWHGPFGFGFWPHTNAHRPTPRLALNRSRRRRPRRHRVPPPRRHPRHRPVATSPQDTTRPHRFPGVNPPTLRRRTQRCDHA